MVTARKKIRSSKLKVFITTDVEILTTEVRSNNFLNAFKRCITDYNKDSGCLLNQLELYKLYNIKGVFLVESLFKEAFGASPLQDIIDLILAFNQEIQLHVHTEWLDFCPDSYFHGSRGKNISDFSLDNQARLIHIASTNIYECGVQTLSGFRAGNYGANLDTLKALARNSFSIDTSYNYCYLRTSCKLDIGHQILQPYKIMSILEFPISCFSQMVGKPRHTQLCAASHNELINMLEQAYRKNWGTFVIVSHSFELKNRSTFKRSKIMHRRMDKLFEYLANNQDRFETCFFSEVDASVLSYNTNPSPLSSGLVDTFFRNFEQAAKRVF